MTQNFTNVFGGNVVPPSAYSYQFITLTENQPFEWPFNSSGDVVSSIMEVSSASVGLSAIMPSAMNVSVGQDILFKNVGMNTFTLKNAEGLAIASVVAGACIYIYLKDNTTPGGEWGVVHYGVGTSSVDAATLVGYGIKAIGASLNQSHPVLVTASSIGLNSTHRAALVNFTGGAEVVTLPAASSLGDDFFSIIRNSGTGTLTIDPYQSETIDNVQLMNVQPGESLFLFCSGSAWYTVGYGRSIEYTFTQLVLDVTSGGPFILSSAEASNKLITFIGTPSHQVEVIVPNVVSVYYLLNSCTTVQNVEVKTATGTGVVVPQNQRIIAICDGTNVYAAQSVSASSTVSLLDGSVALPSLNFASQTNTGLYKYSTSGLGIAVAGVDIAHFEPSGATFNGTSPIVSAKIGPNTAQQHAIPAVAPDTLTLNNATQTLTNKTLVAANNNIQTAPSGNLLATELNAALAELEGEITAQGTVLSNNVVLKTSSTGSMGVPAGTTAQRDGSPVYGAQRANTTLNQQEWWNGTAWVPMGDGATAAGTSFTPTGDIAATNVQAAIVELDSETQAQFASVNAALSGPAFRAFLAADQNSTPNTSDKCLLTEAFDTNSCYDPVLARFTPTVPGIYSVQASVKGQGTTISAIVCEVRKNGGGELYNITSVAYTGASCVSVAGLVSMNGTTDYLELWGQVNAASGISFVGLYSQTFLSAALVRAA